MGELKGNMAQKRKSWLDSGAQAAVDLDVSILIIVPSCLCSIWIATGASLSVKASMGNMPMLQNQCSLHVLFFHLSKVLTTGPVSDNAVILDSKLDNEVHQQ